MTIYVLFYCDIDAFCHLFNKAFMSYVCNDSSKKAMKGADDNYRIILQAYAVAPTRSRAELNRPNNNAISEQSPEVALLLKQLYLVGWLTGWSISLLLD